MRKSSRGKKKVTSSVGILKLVPLAVHANSTYVPWCLLNWNLVTDQNDTLMACILCLWAIVSAANWIIKALCSKDCVNWDITAKLRWLVNHWWNWKVRCWAIASSPTQPFIFFLNLSWGMCNPNVGGQNLLTFYVFMCTSVKQTQGSLWEKSCCIYW